MFERETTCEELDEFIDFDSNGLIDLRLNLCIYREYLCASAVFTVCPYDFNLQNLGKIFIFLIPDVFQNYP